MTPRALAGRRASAAAFVLGMAAASPGGAAPAPRSETAAPPGAASGAAVGGASAARDAAGAPAPLAADGSSPSYRVARATHPGEALLRADDGAWAKAAAITWGPAAYLTRFRALWSDAGLFLRFDATDPSPWHTMTGRDEHLWDEEVVEIFLDPDRSGRHYYELEINPANVVCDLRMISPWPDKKGEIEWDLAGLETRVAKKSEQTGPAAAASARGWTATAFLPWAGLRPLPSARAIALPPRPGDAWRFNVFRIERPGGKQEPEKDAVFAAWSPPSEKSFHDAKAFRDLVFEGAPH